MTVTYLTARAAAGPSATSATCSSPSASRWCCSWSSAAPSRAHVFGVSAPDLVHGQHGHRSARSGAVLGVGARIAVERDAGWNRQLRLTPLPAAGLRRRQGHRPACCVALPRCCSSASPGDSPATCTSAATQWAEVIGLGWVAILPMAVVGVGLGYSSSRRQRAGRQRRHRHADVDVRRHLVPDRRDLAGLAAVTGARPADVLDHPDHPGAAHPRLAGGRRLGWSSRSGSWSGRGSRRAATAPTTCARPDG